MVYAWYCGDAGLQTNNVGQVTNWQNQAASGTPAARNLDRISGTPLAVVCQTTGGPHSVLRCDGASGVWGSSAKFGMLTSDRTLVAYCRLSSTNNGFLFDGSTTSPGLTRAQVRDGWWQVGLQPGSGGNNADTNTFATAPGVWSAHVFLFKRLIGGTLVAHISSAGDDFAYTNALTSGLGGLILGKNVAAGRGLAVDIAEFLVYDRALELAERQEVIDYLATKWGAPTEIPPAACTAAQTTRAVPNFGLHALLDAQVFGPTNSLALEVTNLTFSLEGTTQPADVESVSVYFTGTAREFRPLTLFGAHAGPFAGALSMTGRQSLSPGVNHFWIAIQPRRTAQWGHRLDATLLSVGVTDGVRVPDVGAPPGFLTLGNHCFETIVRKEGDEGVHTYRIPAIVTTTRGTLLAAFDIRHDSAADLPANIDVGILRSVDGGSTWGPMIKALDFDKDVAGSSGNGVGDPALLVDRHTATLWVAGLWSCGAHAYVGSLSGLSTNRTGQYVLARSDDDGLTWSAPINITAQAKVNTNWGVCFVGPGHGIQLRDGTLVFPSQHTDPGGVNARAFFIYSTNHGASWLASPDVNPTIPPQLNENQMVELNSGQIMVSSRAPSGGNGKRVWATYTRGATPGDGTWSPLTYLNPDPVCQASFLRYSSTLEGAPRNRLLFANPASSSARVNMTVRMSEDEGQSWTVSRSIDTRPAAYSDLTVLPDGTIGLLYETGSGGPYETLTFARFDLDWLTQADVDQDGDGMSDYYESINRLNRDLDDARDDADGDGASNLDEFQAGTMADDPQSVFRLRALPFGATGVELICSTVPGIPHSLENAPTPTGVWETVPGAAPFVARDPSRTFHLPLAATSNLFFRAVAHSWR